MPTDIPHAYTDACVLLSFINGNPERLPAIEAVLSEARQGKVRLMTSTLTIVEVAFAAAEQLGRALDPDVERKLDSLWSPGAPISLVEFSSVIASRARGIIREGLAHGWSLKSSDAIHLASAVHWGAAHFHTYDSALTKYGQSTGLIVSEPEPPQLQLPGA